MQRRNLVKAEFALFKALGTYMVLRCVCDDNFCDSCLCLHETLCCGTNNIGFNENML